jgi:HD-GYP domain-containing protein (c-di-GMP phosphodiesterase class II)
LEKLQIPPAAGRRLVLLCGVAPALLTVALALSRPASLTQLDRRIYDGMLRSVPTIPPDNRVFIVDIDDRSLAAIGQWPWSRDVMARLVTRLLELGAASVALDIIFPEADRFQTPTMSPLEGSPDGQLADALRTGNVILGYAFTFHAGTRPAPCVMHPLNLAIIHPVGGNAQPPAFRATGAMCNVNALADSARASGFLNAMPDPDGMLRRMPLLIEYDGRVYPGLALAAVMAATRTDAVALRTVNDNAVFLDLDTGFIPLDGRSNLLLRYRGGSHSLPYVSAADVLQGRAPAAAFKNAVVVVGATALGTRDGVSTPYDTVFPGVEVQATVADNLLRRDFISRPPDALTVEMAGVLGLGIAITLIVARLGLAWGTVAGGIALIVVWRGALWMLEASGNYVSPLFPTIGLMASLGTATIAKLAHERRRADRAAGEKESADRMMVQSLLSLTEIRDAETGNHSRRTQQYSRLLAQELCEHPRFREYLTPTRIDLLSTLAPLHDIGKVGVPDQLLNKPGALTAEEFHEMKKHPVYGLTVITTAQQRAGARDDATLTMAKDIVYTHHERWDGKGYPQGLKGEQIPIPGRLIAIVDVYDALTTARCYRQPLAHERAVEMIVDGEGTHFDPAVVGAFVRSAPLLQIVAHDVTGADSAALHHSLS